MNRLDKIELIHEDYIQMVGEIEKPEDMAQADFDVQFQTAVKACDEIRHLKEAYIKEPNETNSELVDKMWEFHELFIKTRVPEDSTLRKSHDIRLEVIKTKKELKDD